MAFLVLMLPMLGMPAAMAQKAGTVALCKDDRTEKGLAAFPRQVDLIEIRTRARLARRELPEALADAQVVAEAQPSFGRAYAERAALNLRSDNPAALTDIAMALRIEPNEPRWQSLAARINLATGDAAAAERFATAAPAAPSPEADLLLRTKARLGRFTDAAADATARLAAAPADAEALLLRSDARLGQGDATTALADVETALGTGANDRAFCLGGRSRRLNWAMCRALSAPSRQQRRDPKPRSRPTSGWAISILGSPQINWRSATMQRRWSSRQGLLPTKPHAMLPAPPAMS